MLELLDAHRGAIFASGYEYPGRYSRWDIGFADPPVEIVACGREFTLRALNERGQQIVQIFRLGLEKHQHLISLESDGNEVRGRIMPMPDYFPEEERSKQPMICRYGFRCAMYEGMVFAVLSRDVDFVQDV